MNNLLLIYCSEISSDVFQHGNCKNAYTKHKKENIKKKENWAENATYMIDRESFSIVYFEKFDYVIIYFKGTSLFSDLEYDFDCRQQTVTVTQDNNENINVHVHMGFYKKYLAVKEEVEYCINNNKDKINQKSILIFSGHSLGAATALFFVAFSSIFSEIMQTSNELYLICFGSPKVGCKHFFEYLNIEKTKRYLKEIISICNQYDIITVDFIYPQWLCHIEKRIVCSIAWHDILHSHLPTIYKKSCVNYINKIK